MDIPTLNNTLHLVILALKVVKKQISVALLDDLDQEHRSVLGFVQVAAHLFETVLKIRQNSGSIETIAVQIHRLACCIEYHFAIVANGNNDGQHLPQVSPLFPLLRAALGGDEDHTEHSFFRLIESANRCRSLQDDMSDIFNELTPTHSEGEEIDDTRFQDSAPYDALIHGVANHLFKAVSCNCDPKSTRDVRLMLDTSWRTKGDSVEERNMDILFPCDSDGQRFWHLVRVHTLTSCCHLSSECDQREESKVKVVAIANPYLGRHDSWREEYPTPLDCLCGHIRQLDMAWVDCISHFEVGNDVSLHKHQCQYDPECNFDTELCLDDLLFPISLSERGKVVIGLQLAHALSCLYDGHWLAKDWGEECLSLFRRGPQGQRVPCTAWLRISALSQPCSNGADSSSDPRDLSQIFKLGIILLELQIGQTISSYVGKQLTHPDVRRAAAIKVFHDTKAHILSDEYIQALDFCLKPTFGEMPLADKARCSDLVRRSLHTNVVLRLKKALGQKTPEDLDLSRKISTPPPRPIGPSSQVLPTPAEGRHPVPAMGQHLGRPYAEIAPMMPALLPDEDNTVTEIEEDFDLFGQEEEHQDNPNRSHDSDKWMKDLRTILNQGLKGRESNMGQNDRPGVEAGQGEIRIKVAVLDTGIDLGHEDFKGQYRNGRIKSIRSWVDNAGGAEDPHGGDISGHGTFISSLLLDLGPRIDLYVARISKSRHFKQGTTKNITEALYHAHMEWKVDIITMSFGYPSSVREIKGQIAKAAQKDILVFAAASNDGGNRARMFPASQHGVFAIHSTDSNGVISGFNPDPFTDHNFSVLGEHVLSAWLTSHSGSLTTRRLSGTSFATPIAVCISAFFLAYVPLVLPNYKSFVHKVNSYDGMRNLLSLLARKRFWVNRDYHYLSLQWYFHEKSPIGITEEIKRALSR